MKINFNRILWSRNIFWRGICKIGGINNSFNKLLSAIKNSDGKIIMLVHPLSWAFKGGKYPEGYVDGIKELTKTTELPIFILEMDKRATNELLKGVNSDKEIVIVPTKQDDPQPLGISEKRFVRELMRLGVKKVSLGGEHWGYNEDEGFRTVAIYGCVRTTKAFIEEFSKDRIDVKCLSDVIYTNKEAMGSPLF